MSFRSDIEQHKQNVRANLRIVFIASKNEVGRSLVEGSPLTGAPGQPVDTGQLRGSWVEEFIDIWRWQITTNLIYAPGIEAGVGPQGPITLRSTVGGFHSRALTIAGWPRIVQEMARRHRTSGIQAVPIR